MAMNTDDDDTPTGTQAYYETIASQEEIYLEAVEEELRAFLISYDPYPSRSSDSTFAKTPGERQLDPKRRSISDTLNDPRMDGSSDEQLEHHAEELITGDSDDPPIGHEAVVEMLKVSLIVRRLGPM